MPAVSSTKQETKVSQSEYQDPMKFVLQVTDKKVRNLEKRKGKLDQIREKVNSGITLEKDQKIALEKYDEVISSLESVHEIQKNFISFNAEWEKHVKKTAKREKAEQQAHERKRIVRLLQIQSLLDSFGSDDVRTHFKSGKYGAVVLTEDNLKQFDDLYSLMNPSRMENTEAEYEEKTLAASEHITNLLDGKDREVVGTTYKELSELLELINKCGYFETRRNTAAETEEGGEEVAEEGVEEAEPEGEESAAPVEEAEAPVQVEAIEAPAQPRLEPEPCPMPLEALTPDMSVMPQPTPHPAPTPITAHVAPGMASTHSPFLETPYNPHPRPRPLQEIVSSVQGNFNFLQDSEIEFDSAPHNDPAVVMAQPMMPSLPTSQAAEAPVMTQQTFASAAFGEAASGLETNSSSVLPERSSQQLLGAASASGVPSQPHLDFPPPQGFGQHPAGDSLFPEDSAQMTRTMMGPAVGEAPASQFNLTSSINMPASQAQDNSGDKKFTMNASAPVFQSMYSQVNSLTGQQELHEAGDQGTGDAPTSDFSQAGFQGNGFQNNGFQSNQRGGNRGNYRGNRGRSGNMSNGYANRGGQGGRGGRATGFTQAFSTRNDYRADGYQGYSSGGFGNQGNPGGFQKRGGNGAGQNRGGPRGGNGAPRGNANRGAPRTSGYPRPVAFN